MDDYKKQLEEKLDTIPQALKDKFAPSIKEIFADHNKMKVGTSENPSLETDPDFSQKKNWLKSMDKLRDAFKAEGGTENQFYALAESVSRSKHDTHQP